MLTESLVPQSTALCEAVELETKTPPNTRLIILRVPPEFNPASAKDIPWRHSIQVPLFVAQKLAWMMNHQFMSDRCFHRWAIVVKAKTDGYSVCQILPPKGWIPESELELPPDCIERPVTNGYARCFAKQINQTFMDRGGKLEGWAVIMKPIGEHKRAFNDTVYVYPEEEKSDVQPEAVESIGQ